MRIQYPVLLAGIWASDTYIKKKVEREIEEGEARVLWKGHVRLQKYYNKGACMNLMEEAPKRTRDLSGALLFLTVMDYLFAWKKRKHGELLALSLLLGGGASNYTDRMKKEKVVDYLKLEQGPQWLRQIIFNLSDICIFLGGILFVIARLREE